MTPDTVTAVETLDSLLRRLICSGWSETLRQQAVATACRIATAAPRPARAYARSVLALLELKGEEAVELRPEIGARLMELTAELQAQLPKSCVTL